MCKLLDGGPLHYFNYYIAAQFDKLLYAPGLSIASIFTLISLYLRFASHIPLIKAFSALIIAIFSIPYQVLI